ncbi:G2/M phase-specific E3 ubiquitin-protein ligase [Nerophis lumbriciformis]|uniref:G2/M phase-specific E3 ubiquitin-protein ligase n=1 Tax=Nerophis lumbriciformis TaxID=546530 RepID=UPI002AE06943|nr:G2/M phase-specific E3 ubiquitin-protein ligase-like [Nerophis lumbriciformis]XP_061843657.1 G2/M phase-specific E3 ubiquitin-protein ligase-like [Nerophis lumbriciformis]XP_061843658.1 G2/M phase-specific E3 ubiquitin-protein ligase-like [Nerophis lumbriciformis]
MKRVRHSRGGTGGKLENESCVLCRSSEDDPALFGDKMRVQEHNLSVHYFCLLTSCGVYQRGKEGEGVLGFLVDDIKRESRRSARLRCCVCKKKGACVGCNVTSCRKMVHFPCGRQHQFISQFTGDFPSYCPDHSPSQSVCVTSDLSLVRSCSVCLDSLDPVLSYHVLKCPSCHGSWFHRDCVQRQAHSAGVFFFRCTLCNNKEEYQEEMKRMGIYMPERDASWELEAHAYSELLEVYSNCDAHFCLDDCGRAHSAQGGWFQVIRCRLCGSRGTHRKCSGLNVDTQDWACPDCAKATDGRASLAASPQVSTRRRSRLPKSPLSSSPPSISCKRPSGSPEELLRALVPPRQLRARLQVEVSQEQALAAAVKLLRGPDFDPARRLSVRFRDHQRAFHGSPWSGDTARKYFFKVLVQQIQDSPLFEGPDGCKNLALDSQALRDDQYFDAGCLLALAVVYGAPHVGFFSPALYQCLFNFPPNRSLSIAHMTPDTHLSRQVLRMAQAESVEQLRDAMAASKDFLEVAGCGRPIGSLQEQGALVEDLVSFLLIARMQLPLQRFREGLQTLGVFEQVQLFPAAFSSVFCQAELQPSAQTLAELFAPDFSPQEERVGRETAAAGYWRHFLFECEAGRSSVSLQDLLRFSTKSERLPAAGLLPPPSISFLHPPGSAPGEEESLFPQSKPDQNVLLLPATSSYQAFKKCMEQAVSHQVHLLL